jgi:uncharacterized membrane protein YcjF (UPF0283 family)
VRSSILKCLTLHSGAVADIVLAGSTATIDRSDAKTLAQSAATRLSAALTQEVMTEWL